MSPVDLVFMALVVVPCVFGLWRGVVGGVAGPAGLILAGVAAMTEGPTVGDLILPEDPMAPLAGFAALFVGVWLVALLVGAGLKRLLAASGLSWADHVGGGLAGAVAGTLAASWVALMGPQLVPGAAGLWDDSHLLPYVDAVADVLEGASAEPTPEPLPALASTGAVVDPAAG